MSDKKIVYVAGPIRSKWRIKRWMNILRARNVAIKLWKVGFAAICPHLNSVTMRHHVDEEEFVDGDLSFVKKADFLVVVDGWLTSVGSKREIEIAEFMKIPVYFDVDGPVFNER